MEVEYFKDFDTDAVYACMDHYPDKGERFHLRTMSIRLDLGALVFPDFRVELFDHYTVEEVLKALEARLQGEPAEEELTPCPL